MFKTTWPVMAAACAVGLAISSGVAHAGLSVSAAVGGAPAGMNYANFDDLPLGSTGGTSGGIAVSFASDAQAVQGAANGLYAPPYLSNGNGAPFNDPNDGPDGTTYLTTGRGSVTLTLPGEERSFGLLWGSVDSYNSLGFYDGTKLVGSLTGSDVTSTASGDQGANGTYYVNITSTDTFDKVVASSSQYAFEFDNVSYVPEPATIALLGAGLLGLGFTRRKSA